MQPVAAVFAYASEADDARIRSDLAALPGQLDHVDGLIEEGTLGGAELNAADFQIATTTRVMLGFAQLRPLIEARPAGEHAMRVSPGFGREFPIGLPEDSGKGRGSDRSGGEAAASDFGRGRRSCFLVQRGVVGHRGQQRVFAAPPLQRELPEVLVTERVARLRVLDQPGIALEL